jgi:hypothetical protein
MSFQAYLDNIEEKTGKAPREFIAMAEAKGFNQSTKAGEILAWLKEDFDLGRGHGMAIVHIIKKGDAVDAKFVNSGGTHSDPADRLNLDGKK